MTDEDRLLILCSRTEVSEPIRNGIRSLMEHHLDWEKLLRSARWHGVAPLLYNSLRIAGEMRCIPTQIAIELKNAYQENLVRNLYLQAELRRILDALCEDAIRVIVLKGSILAPDIYGDVGLRCMSDMDLMVRKEELSRADRTMSRLGYTIDERRPLKRVKTNDCHIRYFNREGNVLVEIHWHILKTTLPPLVRKIDERVVEKWWENARSSGPFGEKALALSPNDSIMFLSFHFIQHRFARRYGVPKSRNALMQLCDIHACVKHFGSGIDWMELGKDAGMERIVAVALRIVQETVGKGDDGLRERFDRLFARDLDQSLIGYLCMRIFTDGDVLPSVTCGGMGSAVQNSFRNRAKALLRELFPPPVELFRKSALPLSSRKLALQYMVHSLVRCMANQVCMWLCFGSPSYRVRRILSAMLSASSG